MALNDTSTIQEMNLDTKDRSYDIKSKELETLWNNECKLNPTNKYYKIFCD